MDHSFGIINEFVLCNENDLYFQMQSRIYVPKCVINRIVEMKIKERKPLFSKFELLNEVNGIYIFNQHRENIFFLKTIF